MKRKNIAVSISCSIILGVVWGLLRRRQMRLAYDFLGLTIPGHSSTMLLGAVTLAGCLLLLVLACRVKGPLHSTYCYSGQRVSPAVRTAAGMLIAISGAAAIPNVTESYYNSALFELVIQYFTVLAGLCIAVQGMASLLNAEGGQKPAHLLGLLCIAGRAILSYRGFSSTPTYADFFFPLLGLLLTVMATLRMASILFKEPKPRLASAYNLLGIAFCVATLFEGHDFAYSLFYAGCAALLAANSCTIMLAVGKELPQEEADDGEEGPEDESELPDETDNSGE